MLVDMGPVREEACNTGASNEATKAPPPPGKSRCRRRTHEEPAMNGSKCAARRFRIRDLSRRFQAISHVRIAFRQGNASMIVEFDGRTIAAKMHRNDGSVTAAHQGSSRARTGVDQSSIDQTRGGARGLTLVSKEMQGSAATASKTLKLANGAKCRSWATKIAA